MRAPNTWSARRTIRFWLNSLAVACILPAVLVAAYLIARSYAQERASLERDTVATARALMQAVDAELAGIVSALQVLAASPYLETGELAKFYDLARVALRTINGDNIVLTDAHGQQLLNTLRPFGEPLPLHGNPDRLRRVLQTTRPVISDLFIGEVIRTPVVAVEVPTFSRGVAAYRLGIGILPHRLGEILNRQKIPPGWVAGILDGAGTIVARTAGAEHFVGKKASPPLLHSLSERSEGMSDGVTLEGNPVFSSFSRSSGSGWTIAIGIPREALTSQLQQSLLFNVTAALVLVVLGALLATAIGRHIARSFGALTAPALTLGSSKPMDVPALKIREAHELGQALTIARKLIEQSSLERDRAELRERNLREEFQVLFESAPNGVLVVNDKGEISLLNAQIESMFAYSRAELLGRTVDILVPDRFGRAHSEFRKSFMRTPQARPMGAGRDLFGRRRDGTEFPVEIALIPITSKCKNVILITVIDISVRKSAETSLAAALAEQDELRRRMMQAQELERLRLARDLHDETGQNLTAAMLELKGVESQLEEKGRERLRVLRLQMEEIGKTLHRVASQLRPASIDELGLTTALSNHLSEWSMQYGIAADFQCVGLDLDRLGDEARTTIYRVVQECLTNVAKHAKQARNVGVVIERVGASLRLIIDDDGPGLQSPSAGERNGGLGLPGMRERLALIGGQLEIETSETGTTIFALIPLQQERLSA
jgi:PAS domain S-box-containing protein